MSNLKRNLILIILVTLTLGSLALTVYNIYFGILSVGMLILLSLGVRDSIQTKHSLLRNYPIIGRLRWVMEHERSKIQQYFIEDGINGTPYNREKRSDVYQKSKKDKNTTPFGTQLDMYEKGYEFVKHSMYPKTSDKVEIPQVTFGTKFTKQPYTTSVFNISAMSYGSLSNAAIKALNGGAKLGNFYQNTGEGGISKYHIEKGGDLVFQIGTGYFGCGTTDKDGVRQFDQGMFRMNSKLPSVKMIELKLSQGAKPGHGGILPAIKNTKEIALIRGVEPNTKVSSPPAHSAFSDNEGMLKFIKKLRLLSNGKPVGIKMCVGNESEIRDLISKMKSMNIYPDFISVDGGEGGTGASPLVYTNRIGTPLLDGLNFIINTLKQYNLRDEIKVIAGGKVSTSFDVVKMLSMGADSINAARSFMLSLGCIQARECDKDTCPVGIATQKKDLIKGLDVASKEVRVYNYHKSLIHEVREVVGSMGLTNVDQLDMSHINKRVSETEIKTFEQLYPNNLMIVTK